MLAKNYSEENEEQFQKYTQLRQQQQELYVQIEELLHLKRYEDVKQLLENKDHPSPQKELFLSGNAVFDNVISQKIFRASKAGIHIQCDIQSVNLMTIQDTDLNVLLSNLLDNAIEATVYWQQQIKPAYPDPVILLRIRMYQQYLLIREENPCVMPIRDDQGRLITIKENKTEHGIGMQSMQRIVNQYAGRMEYRVEDCRFVLQIIMKDGE